MFYDSGWMEDCVRKYMHREITREEYKKRIGAVNEFERQLRDGGYLLLKLFVDIDGEEQRKRMRALRENFETEWRVTREDLWQQREYKLFRECYETFMEKTGKLIPWHVLDGSKKSRAAHEALRLLTEQVEGAKNRVPVDSQEGYILELDNYWSNEPLWIRTNHNHNFTFKHPKVASEEGMMDGDEKYRFILDFMNRLETAIYGADYKDPVKGYRAYLDEYTFARWYLVQEIIGNYDTNMYMMLRNHSSKLECCPVWDAEWSLGLAGIGTNGWARPPQKPVIEGNIKRSQLYIYQMMHDPYFIAIVKDEWAKLKAQMPDILKTMRDYCTQIEVAQRTNFKRWPILDQYISVGLIHLGSWEAEVEYVFDFFEKRCAWFDAWLATQ